MQKLHSSYRFILFSFILLLAGAACGQNATETAVQPTQPVEVQTVVVVVTETAEEAPANSDAPILAAPTASAGEPTMTALVDLNVRTGPGANYPVVGALRAGASARIIGRSPSGHWWKIECPPGAGTECWSSAGSQYSTATNVAGVAVAAVPPAPPPPASATPTTSTHEATSSPTPTSATNATASPTTTGATATATINSETSPTATATTATNATATATTTYTPTPTPTEAAQVAPFDNDSLQNPAVSVFFSPTGQREFTHSNDVSYENGDQEDWVEFEFPNNANTSQSVWVTLDCAIAGINAENAQLRATLWQNSSGTTQIVLCNEGEVQLTINNTQVQQLRVHFGITAADIYATYNLRVVGYK